MMTDAFGSTQHSLIERARSGDPAARRLALGELAERYLPPLATHLRVRWRLDQDQADEALQEFVHRKLLAGNLLDRPSPGAGRFRHWLVKALDNFQRDRWRQQRAAQKHQANLPGDPLLPVCELTDDDVLQFDRLWARSLLATAIRRLESDCQARDDLVPVWQVFAARVLVPAGGGVAPSVAQVARSLGLPGTKEVANRLVTAKRKLEAILRELVADDQPGGLTPDEELAHLRDVLAQPGAFDWRSLSAELAQPAASRGEESIDVRTATPQFVAAWLCPAQVPDVWSTSDLADLWEQYAEISFDRWVSDDSTARGRLKQADASAWSLARCASEIPPLELLMELKREFRRQYHAGEGLPAEFSMTCYFLMIGLAAELHEARISRSDDAVLAAGFRRVAECAWLPETWRTRLARQGGGN